MDILILSIIIILLVSAFVTMSFRVTAIEKDSKVLKSLFITNCTRPITSTPSGKVIDEHLEQITILTDERGEPKGVITAAGRSLLVESLKYTAQADGVSRLEIVLQGGMKLNNGEPNIQFVKMF